MNDPQLAFLNKIPDQAGYLVIENGAIVKSDGDLANRESVAMIAEKMANMMRYATLPGSSYRQIHVTYPDHSIIMEFQGKYLYVVKRRVACRE